MRTERLRSAIREAISDVLHQQLKDPRVGGLVSVTEVELSRDHKVGVVHVSVMGDETARERALEGLERARGFIRTELARRFRLRQVPELAFRLDRSIERGARVLELLAQEAARRDPGDGD
ncbi:MAG: 30S ribosome-binding factor RbfA [bacterium]|nr:30S ribosome-binding factor RbfA [bacterium]